MNLKQLEGALSRLGEMLEEYSHVNDLDPRLQEAVKESLLQRFEYSQEAAWKTAKRYLTEVEGYPKKMGPKRVIRLCGELGLLNAEKWLAYLEARQDTSHDYDKEKALAVLEIVPRFHSDAQAFLGELASRIPREDEDA